MLRHAPAEYYLKYLLCHPDGYTDEQILELLQAQELHSLGASFLGRLRNKLVIPRPFRPEERTHQRSQDFLRKERIWSMFHPDDDMRLALTILAVPRTKMLVEAMLLAQAAPEYVAVSITRRARHQLTAKAVSRYAHFFYNIELVGPTVMKAFINAQSSILSEPTGDLTEAAVQTCLAQEVRWDPRRLVARMAGSHLALLLNDIRLGYLPSNVDLSKLLTTTRVAATTLSLDSLLQQSPERAAAYASVAQMIHNVLVDVGDGGQELQSQLAQLALEREHSEIPRLIDLPLPSGEPPRLLEAQGKEIKNG